jgi:hypothetical protein
LNYRKIVDSTPLRVWLVDGADNGLAHGGQVLQHHDDVLRHVRVQSRRGLVAKEERRIGEDLAGKRQQLGLAARDTLDAAGDPDERVLAPDSPNSWQDLVNSVNNLVFGRIFLIASKIGESSGMSCQVSGQARGRRTSKKLA